MRATPNPIPEKLISLSHAQWLLSSDVRPPPSTQGLKIAAERCGVLQRPPGGGRGMRVPLSWIEKIRSRFLATGYLLPRKSVAIEPHIAA